MIRSRLALVVVAVVLTVWASSVVADVLLTDYRQPWAVNLVVFGTVGFLIGPRLFRGHAIG